jgi:hypothetical protein
MSQSAQVKARYCRTLDTKDWAGYADVFTEDFELDTSAAGGPPTIYGREAAIPNRTSLEPPHQSHLANDIQRAVRRGGENQA